MSSLPWVCACVCVCVCVCVCPGCVHMCVCVCVCVCVCLVAQLCLTLCDPIDCGHQSPLFMALSRQEHWSGLPLPPPGDLPHPRIETAISCTRRQILYHLSHQGSPHCPGEMQFWRRGGIHKPKGAVDLKILRNLCLEWILNPGT